MDLKKEEDMHIQTRIRLEKNLASPDKFKREKTMSLLCLWLTSQKVIREEELEEIWKGLFFCLVHADRREAQEHLVEKLAILMGKLDAELSLLFFKVFLTSLRKKWDSIDKASLGRFHLLLNQYVSNIFAIMKKNHWKLEVVRNFMDALAERALVNASDAICISVYISGAFLDGLRQYLPIPAGVFKVMLEPFWEVLAKGCDDKLAEEISTKVFFVLFDHGSRGLICNRESWDSDEKKKLCFSDLAIDLALSIRTKSSALLAFTSSSKSVQLRLIEEKFKCLTKLGQSQISNMGNSVNVSTGQIDTQNANFVAENLNRLQNSHEQSSEARTFGRRSKRNQKLVFSPQAVEDLYTKKIVEKTESVKEKPSENVIKEIDADDQSENTPSKVQPDVMASEPELNLERMDIVNIDSWVQNQSTLIDDATDAKLVTIDDPITMEDPVISNLAKRFESIVDQSPCCQAEVLSVTSTPLAPSPINTGGRKRKSCKSAYVGALHSESPTSAKENEVMLHDPFQEDEINSIDNLSAKKAKKVHFSLEHNIVWRPSTPLPPHNVRVPPAATPRGSAMKKGVPPGPIADLVEVSVSPKKKKPTPKKALSANLKSHKNVKNSTKAMKSTKRGRLSPR